MKKQMTERFGDEIIYDIFPPAPPSLNIELNNTCNQHCVFCPFHSKFVKKEENPSHMNVEFAKKILDKAHEQGIGKKEIGFYSTGEALLHNGLEACIEYAKKLGCPYVFLTTNGVLATPERMLSLIHAGLDSIRFSVNAHDAALYHEIHGTDSFGTVMENIRFLSRQKKQHGLEISTSVSSVITRKTKDHMDVLHALFDDLVDEVVFIPVMDVEFLGEEVASRYAVKESILSNEERRVCPVPFNSMYIGSHGKARICCDARARDITAGNLNEEIDLMKLWKSDILVKYRKMTIRDQ